MILSLGVSMTRFDNGPERFYNLRLPNTLSAWGSTFEKTERSQILRAFIALCISMGQTARGRSMIRQWANGQRQLVLEPPRYLKGTIVPPIVPGLEDTNDERS